MNTAIKLIVTNEAGEKRTAKTLPLNDELLAVLDAISEAREMSDAEVVAGAREQYEARTYYNAHHHPEEHLSVDAWDAFMTFADDAGLGIDPMLDESHLCAVGLRVWKTFRAEFESCGGRG